MIAKDEELNKVKEKQVYAEQQLVDMEVKQQQVRYSSEHGAGAGHWGAARSRR